MGKITFRAEDELVDELEALETSKSEAMREALRSYLDSGPERVARASDRAERPSNPSDNDARSESTSIDDLVRERVDEVLAARLDRLTGDPKDSDRRPSHSYRSYDDRRVPQYERSAADTRRPPSGNHSSDHQQGARDLNVTISLEGKRVRVDESDAHGDSTEEPARADSSDRPKDQRSRGNRPRDESQTGTTCGQCGESVDDEHVYCPNCGEKATRRLFCDCGDELRSDWAFCPSCGRRTPSADVLEPDRHASEQS